MQDEYAKRIMRMMTEAVTEYDDDNIATGEDLDASVRRLVRATQELRTQQGEITRADLVALMSTHSEGGLCRHDETETVFSVVIAPQERTMWYSRGNPCNGSYKAFSY